MAARRAAKGFTLIELLITISIIVILTTFVLQGLAKFRADGRDSKRVADLRIVQQYLDLYFEKCGFYPGRDLRFSTGLTIRCPASPTDYSGRNSDWDDLRRALTNSNLGISALPDDPLCIPSCGSTHPNYDYRHDFSSFQRYILQAKFENPEHKLLSEDIDNDPSPDCDGDGMPDLPYQCVSDFGVDCGLPGDDVLYCVGIGN